MLKLFDQLVSHLRCSGKLSHLLQWQLSPSGKVRALHRWELPDLLSIHWTLSDLRIRLLQKSNRTDRVPSVLGLRMRGLFLSN